MESDNDSQNNGYTGANNIETFPSLANSYDSPQRDSGLELATPTAAAAVPNLNTPAAASNVALALRAAGTSVTNWLNTSIPIAPVAIPLGRASYLATVRSRPVTRSVSAQNARAAADTESESTTSDSEEPELPENEAEYTDGISTSESADSLNLF